MRERLAGAAEGLATGEDWLRAVPFAARFRLRSLPTSSTRIDAAPPPPHCDRLFRDQSHRLGLKRAVYLAAHITSADRPPETKMACQKHVYAVSGA